MIWESEISENLLAKPIPFKGVIQPSAVMCIYIALTIISITTVLPLWIYFNIWQWWTEILARTVLILSGLYSIVSFVVTLHVIFAQFFRLRRQARKFIDGAWSKP
jgi:hypothetical protein